MTREEIAEVEQQWYARTGGGAGYVLGDVSTEHISRALVTARAYLDLVERIEKEAERQQYSYDRWKADGTADTATMHAAWHTAMVLRALLPQKEPTA